MLWHLLMYPCCSQKCFIIAWKLFFPHYLPFLYTFCINQAIFYCSVHQSDHSYSFGTRRASKPMILEKCTNKIVRKAGGKSQGNGNWPQKSHQRLAKCFVSHFHTIPCRHTYLAVCRPQSTQEKINNCRHDNFMQMNLYFAQIWTSWILFICCTLCSMFPSVQPLHCWSAGSIVFWFECMVKTKLCVLVCVQSAVSNIFNACLSCCSHLFNTTCDKEVV